jgi:hypothetical protein
MRLKNNGNKEFAGLATDIETVSSGNKNTE